MSGFPSSVDRLRAAQTHGFTFTDDTTFGNAFMPYSNAHDDGPFCGLSLGGIGAGNFGRDLHGHFNRWHLQNGYHRKSHVESANLCSRWKQGARVGFCRLGTEGWDRPLPAGWRSVHALFPVTVEHVRHGDWPLELVVESRSPIIPHDYEASCLPVAFDVVCQVGQEEDTLRLPCLGGFLDKRACDAIVCYWGWADQPSTSYSWYWQRDSVWSAENSDPGIAD